MIDLEKVDILRERFGVTYEEAREVLERNCDDLVASLIELEKRSAMESSFDRATRRVKDGLNEAWTKGKATKIKFKKDGRVVLNVPAPLGAAGLIGMMSSGFLAMAGVVGAVAAMTNDVKVEIETPPEEDEKNGSQAGC